MSDTTNINDLVSGTKKTIPQELNRLYQGGSPGTGYDSLTKKLKNDDAQQFCFACAQAGQLCAKHVKSDIPIVSGDELFGNGAYPGSSKMNQKSPTQTGGVYLIVDLSNPKGYMIAQDILKAVSEYYAKQQGKAGYADQKYTRGETASYRSAAYAPASKSNSKGE